MIASVDHDKKMLQKIGFLLDHRTYNIRLNKSVQCHKQEKAASASGESAAIRRRRTAAAQPPPRGLSLCPRLQLPRTNEPL